MKMTRKIHVVFVFLVLIMAGVMVRAKTSRAVNALRIPAEFTTMNESVTWEKSITRVDITYDDGKKALSTNMKISFDLYIPAKLLSNASTTLTVNPTIGLFDEDWSWDYQIEAKIVDIIVRRSGGGYSATWYDKNEKKEKVIGNTVKCKRTGKYILLHVSNLPLKEKGLADNGKPRPIKGKKRNLELSINLVANAKQNVTFYLKNTQISSGNKTLYSSSHDKDDVYSYASVNKLKEGLLYVSSFNNNKLPKFEGIPDDIRNATAKRFVKISDKKATENKISKATKEKAKKFAVASYNSLPKWHGTHLNNMYEYGWTESSKQIPYYTEKLIKEVANEGFNFVRVPLDTRIFYSQTMTNGSGFYYKGDGSKVNLNVLENIDNLITWCVKYGIHVCLDVHNTPGGYMIGGDEEASRELLFKNGSKEQKMFYNFWKLITARYKDVSTNALSYNPYNEPPHFATDEAWTKMMKHVIDDIHGVDPTRLIFVDMLDYGKKPCYGLVGEKIVQSSHIYDPMQFTHSYYREGNYLNSRIHHGYEYKPTTYDYEANHLLLEKRVKDIVDFSNETGTTVMVQEFGCTCYSYMKDIVAYFDDILTLFDDNGINWAQYGYDTQDFGYVATRDVFRSSGGTYVKINPHRYVAKELREVLRKHMQ